MNPSLPPPLLSPFPFPPRSLDRTSVSFIPVAVRSSIVGGGQAKDPPSHTHAAAAREGVVMARGVKRRRRGGKGESREDKSRSLYFFFVVFNRFFFCRFLFCSVFGRCTPTLHAPAKVHRAVSCCRRFHQGVNLVEISVVLVVFRQGRSCLFGRRVSALFRTLQ